MNDELAAPLAPLTTLRVGGPASRLRTVTTQDETIAAVREADAAGTALLVLSGGSNVVVADDGFPGDVVRIGSRGVDVEHAGADVTLRIAAGHPWDDVVTRAVAEGWSGIEALSGIPGAAGSTPVQNVGAYGQEISQTVLRVRVWDRATHRVRTLAAAECAFGYRDSLFKRSPRRFVVLEVALRLRPTGLSTPIRYPDLAAELGVRLGERVPLAEARAGVLAQRRARGMVLDESDHDTWSCGSFFTNPVLSAAQVEDLAARVRREGHGVLPVYPGPHEPGAADRAGASSKTSAAWLIDHAGFGKGHGLPGPAALSSKHVLAITNRGGAGASDVLALARSVRDGVRDRFGVTLQPEPVLVGCRL